MTMDNGDGIVVSNNNDDGLETDTTLTQDVSIMHSSNTNDDLDYPIRPAVIRHTVVFEVDAEVATVASTNSEDSGNNNIANRQVGNNANAYATDPIRGQSLPIARAVGEGNNEGRERVRLEISWKGVILFILTFGALCFIALLIKLSKR